MLADFATIRQAQPLDAPALSQVFRDSWQLAYRGIIPQPNLGVIIARRDAAWWRESLGRRGNILVLEANGAIAGYTTFGRSRAAGQLAGEIYELYLAPDHQGMGFGERLFESARQRLDDQRLSGLVVWALSDNISACDFYWRRGGRPIGKSTEKFGGKALAKTEFGWQ